MRVRPNHALCPPLLCIALVLGACVGLPASARATGVVSNAGATSVAARNTARSGNANRSGAGGVHVGVNPLWQSVESG